MAGLYLHIPLCITRCVYCDFFSNTDLSVRKKLVSALCEELKLRYSYLKNEQVETIYFGGGTPSLLQQEDFVQLFETMQSVGICMDRCEEITLEANPDDLTDSYLNMLRQLPFNRISVGIQSFQNDELKMLNRRHTAEEAIAAVVRCKEYGLYNRSIDLMYGLPGQTLEKWKTTLQQAVQLKVPHISAYHLTYEEGTVIYREVERKQLFPVTEQMSVDLFEMLTSILKKNGYEQYEISNFALPGYYSHHNSSYWKEIPYLGIGPSAHSYDGSSRQWNVASLSQWIAGVESGHLNYEREKLAVETRYNDYVVTSLRTIWGLSLTHVREAFGIAFYNYCLKMAKPYVDKEALILKENCLQLTHNAILISDGIITDLLYVI